MEIDCLDEFLRGFRCPLFLSLEAELLCMSTHSFEVNVTCIANLEMVTPHVQVMVRYKEGEEGHKGHIFFWTVLPLKPLLCGLWLGGSWLHVIVVSSTIAGIAGIPPSR